MTDPKVSACAGKLRYHCTPAEVEEPLAAAMAYGAAKYGLLSWRNSVDLSDARKRIYYDAARRHMAEWHKGNPTDPESGLPHLAHAMASLGILMDLERMEQETPAPRETYEALPGERWVTAE